MDFHKDICGPFAKGLKCHLSSMKTGTIGQILMSYLFMCTSEAKFLVIYPIGEEKLYFHETLEPGKTYWLKNVKKKEVKVEGFEDIFEATSQTKLSLAKRPLQNPKNFEETEAREILSNMQSVKEEDLDITPVAKKIKLEVVRLNTNISLFEFLTTPLIETRNKLVEMTVLGNFFPQYDNDSKFGYHRLIVCDISNKNVMKEIIIYCESAQISKNIANNSILKRGSVIAMKGEFLRCKGFGTPSAEFFAEKVKRPEARDEYAHKMEFAISNYRKAAEKTFMHTMPDKEFRNMNDESIERKNLRLTCPIEVKQMNWTQVRVARFTEIADFLEKMAELEKGEKVSVETVLFTVSDVATYRESSGVLLINNQAKGGLFDIADNAVRNSNSIIEKNGTYLGVISQKSEKDNLNQINDGSTLVKMSWIERVDEEWIDDMRFMDTN